MADDRYTPGTHLEIPGLEAILEYGNASSVKRDRIPGAMLINDHSRLDRVRVTQMDGLHDDPEGTDARQPDSDRHGERAGNMLYRGRTVGLTGRAEAGNISAMRSNWRRFRGQFGTTERDLLVHHPYEVRALVNEVANPSLEVDEFGWQPPVSTGGGTASALTGGVVDSVMKVGSMTVTSATGAGILRTYGLLSDLATDVPVVSAWDGEDVWITVCIKVQSSTGTVTSLAIGVAQWIYIAPGNSSAVLSANQASVASPATGAWKTITFRVPASVIAPTTTHVTPFVAMGFSSAGTYTARFYRCASVLLDPAEPAPAAYFDGDTPGFEWQGVARRSTSIGPTHAVNKIQDPRFEILTTASRLLARWKSLGTAATYNTSPSRSTLWSGDHVDGSLYVKATKIATSSAVFGVVNVDAATLTQLPVVSQRIYRLSAKINTLQKPAGGTFNLSISWINDAAGVISTITSENVALGENSYSVVGTAPDRACGAQVLAQMTGTTSAGQVLEFFLSDPCFVDITDWDPGDFYGVGDAAEEAGDRRRIPRPFLLQRVRKTSDMKAPEQQTRNRAWRDFTMSLRASDPRVYVLDERHEWTQMVGTPQLVFANMGPLVVDEGLITTPPTGFTVEGQTGTASWHYDNQSMFDARSMMSIGGQSQLSAAAPAATAIQRAYRTAESYTYTNPRAIIHGHFQMKWLTSGIIPSAVEATGANFSYNSIGVLLKRVSSSQWIEVRVNSSNNAQLASLGLTGAPYTVEIWSSHNASGAAAVTRLTQWDVSSGASISDPSQYPMEIQAEIDILNNLNLVITGTNSSGVAVTILTQSYPLPGPLLSLFGSTVAGQVGERIRSDNWGFGSTGWASMVSKVGFPWVSYFEVVRAENFPVQIITCPVIGNVDTPPRIVLKGDLNSPILLISTPDEDGTYQVSTMRLNGIASEANPVTVDVGKGTIEDASGANRYSMLDSGSLKAFLPGLSYVVVSARGWGSYPQHVQVSWRDALR